MRDISAQILCMGPLVLNNLDSFEKYWSSMLQDNLLLEFIIIKKPDVFWGEDQRGKVPFQDILGLYAINMIYDSWY